MPRKKVSVKAKAKAISKVGLKNTIKINIGQQKPQRRRAPVKRQQQMEKQPPIIVQTPQPTTQGLTNLDRSNIQEKNKALEGQMKQTNDLLLHSLLSTNQNVLQLANKLNQPSFIQVPIPTQPPVIDPLVQKSGSRKTGGIRLGGGLRPPKPPKSTAASTVYSHLPPALSPVQSPASASSGESLLESPPSLQSPPKYPPISAEGERLLQMQRDQEKALRKAEQDQIRKNMELTSVTLLDPFNDDPGAEQERMGFLRLGIKPHNPKAIAWIKKHFDKLPSDLKAKVSSPKGQPKSDSPKSSSLATSGGGASSTASSGGGGVAFSGGGEIFDTRLAILNKLLKDDLRREASKVLGSGEARAPAPEGKKVGSWYDKKTLIKKIIFKEFGVDLS